MSGETDISPGCEGEPARTIAPSQRAALTIRLPAKRPLKPFDVFQRNLFERRVQTFLQSLPAFQREEIARRQRFRNQPYLRRADQPDPSDFLP